MTADFDKAYWEERYRGHGGSRRARPNPQLLVEVADLAPGTALDAGCGEGADAVWLASHGWKVTAVDIARGALRRAREHVDALGGDLADRIEWVAADLDDWLPTGRGFDLVSTHYVHTPGPRAELYRRLAASVAPGGTLLIVGHDPSDHDDTSAHAPAPGSLVTPAEIAASLDPDGWDVDVAETRSRQVTGHDGREIAVRDAVFRARKRR